MSTSRRRAAGFTLVELLVVILIIGILIALLIPAVGYVIKKTKMSAGAFELSQLEQGVQAYKQKYSDYPPDFSDVRAIPVANWPAAFQTTVTYRHINKVFQNITAAELLVVGNYIKGNELTPAEALVFWLGGLSSSPTNPFTGTGGPLLNIGTQANPIWVLRIQERNAPIFTFDEGRLIQRTNQNGQVIAAAYAAKFTTTPYAYFDSRTYNFVYIDGNGNSVPEYTRNVAPAPSDPAGITIALPYKSDIVNTSFPNSQNDSILLDNQVYFINRDTFQIVSPGLDGLYGPIVNPTANFGAPDAPLWYQDANGTYTPLFTRFPSGNGYHSTEWVTNANRNVTPTLDYYLEGQEDNLGSFSDGKTIEDAQQQ